MIIFKGCCLLTDGHQDGLFFSSQSYYWTVFVWWSNNSELNCWGLNVQLSLTFFYPFFLHSRRKNGFFTATQIMALC